MKDSLLFFVENYIYSEFAAIKEWFLQIPEEKNGNILEGNIPYSDEIYKMDCIAKFM